MDITGAPPGATDNEELPTHRIDPREPAPPRWPRGYVYRDPATGAEMILAPEDVSLIVDPDPDVTELEALPAVSVFRRLDIGPGDVLVYETADRMDAAMAARVKAELGRWFPGVEVRIVAGARLYVASVSAAPERIDVSTLGEAPGSRTVDGPPVEGQCPVCRWTGQLDHAGRVPDHAGDAGLAIIPCRGSGRYPHPRTEFP